RHHLGDPFGLDDRVGEVGRRDFGDQFLQRAGGGGHSDSRLRSPPYLLHTTQLRQEPELIFRRSNTDRGYLAPFGVIRSQVPVGPRNCFSLIDHRASSSESPLRATSGAWSKVRSPMRMISMSWLAAKRPVMVSSMPSTNIGCSSTRTVVLASDGAAAGSST